MGRAIPLSPLCVYLTVTGQPNRVQQWISKLQQSTSNVNPPSYNIHDLGFYKYNISENRTVPVSYSVRPIRKSKLARLG